MKYLMVLVVSLILAVTNASPLKANTNIRHKRQTYGNTQYNPNAYNAASASNAYDPALYDPNNAAGGGQQTYRSQQAGGYGQQPSYSTGNQAYGQQAAGYGQSASSYGQTAYGNQQPAYGTNQAGYSSGNANSYDPASYGYGR